MEGVGVVVTVGNAFNDAVFFAVDFGEATGEAFSWGANNTEVKVVFL